MAFCSDASLTLFSDDGAAALRRAQLMGLPLPSLTQLQLATKPADSWTLAEGADQYADMCELIASLSGFSPKDIIDAAGDRNGQSDPLSVASLLAYISCRLPVMLCAFVASIAGLCVGRQRR